MVRTRENTLINDVCCGFTNYIFQAFNSERRLIARRKLSEFSVKVLIFLFLFTFVLITIALLINYTWIEWMRALLIEIFHFKWKYIIFPFFSFPPLPLLFAHGTEKQIRWKILRYFPSVVWDEKFLNLLFKWVEIYLKFGVDICEIHHRVYRNERLVREFWRVLTIVKWWVGSKKAWVEKFPFLNFKWWICYKMWDLCCEFIELARDDFFVCQVVNLLKSFNWVVKFFHAWSGEMVEKAWGGNTSLF